MMSRKQGKKKHSLASINYWTGGLMILTLYLVFIWPKLVIALCIMAVVAILIGPIADYVIRCGLDYGDAVALMIIIAILIVLLGSDFVRPLILDEPRITNYNSIQAQNDYGTSNLIPKKSPSIYRFFSHLIHNRIFEIGFEWHNNLQKFFVALVTSKWKVVLVLLLSQILIIGVNSLRRELLLKVPNKSFEFTAALFSSLSKNLFNYVRTEFGNSLLVGILITVALKLLGFTSPLTYGMFAALVIVIPRWGILLGMAFPVFEIITTGNFINLIGVLLAFATTALFSHALFYQAFQRNRPKLSLFSQILVPAMGIMIAGLPGLLLAIPIVSVLRLIWLAINEVVLSEHGLEFRL